MNARSLTVAALTTLCAAACALLLIAAPALATKTHFLTHSFGSPGSGAGQLSLLAYTEGAPDSGVAVNSTTHDVYVADTGNHRVDQFEANGTFVRAWGWGVVAGGLGGFEICTPASLGCQAGTSGSGAGQFTTPTFIAVDNDLSSASYGDVYVGDATDHLVSKFNSEGKLEESWGVKGQLDGSGAVGGPFASIAGIAVDASGNLFVYDYENHNWFEFAQDGTPDPTTTVERGTHAVGIGVDGAGNLYKVVGLGNLEKFNSAGEDTGPVDVQGQGQNGDTGLAIDLVTNEIYTDAAAGSLIDTYESSSCEPSGGKEGTPCTPTESFGSGTLSAAAGLAVDGSDQTVYAADAGNARIDAFAFLTFPDATTKPASAIGQTSATLHGEVNPEGIELKECLFEYAPGKTVACKEGVGEEPGEIGKGTGPVPVEAEVKALAPDTTYEVRLLAINENGRGKGEDEGEGAVEPFTTLGPPTVDSTSVLSVLSTTASLAAQIDPRGFEATYHAEYIDDAQFQENVRAAREGFTGATRVPSSSSEDRNIGAGQADVSATAQLAGLQPETVYHYRFLAASVQGTSPAGPDHTFTTFPPPAGFALPDRRAYELVSPTAKNGGQVDGGRLVSMLWPNPLQSSLDGEAVTFASSVAFPGAPASLLANQYLARRGPEGWTTRAITPAVDITAIGGRQAAEGPTSSGVYQGFSEDLSVGFLQTGDPQPLAAAPEVYWNPYLRNLSEGGYRLLEEQAPPAQPPGGPYELPGVEGLVTRYAGSTPDGAAVVFSANDALTPEAVPGKRNLYEWAAGALHLVSVLPDASPDPGTDLTFGAAGPEGGHRVPREVDQNFSHVISADGSRVFWTGSDGNIYVRENTAREQSALAGGHCTEPAKACTVLVSAGGLYATANSEGSQVLYTKETKIGTYGPLYRYDVETGETTELTPGGEIAGVLGASEDGSYVYYAVGKAAIAKEEKSPRNLYVYHNGTSTFIATDEGVCTRGQSLRNCDWSPGNVWRTARVSPNGLYLAFQSDSSLTGYENTGPACVPTEAGVGNGSGEVTSYEPGPCSEVFLYDAAAARLSCASCNPSGAAPAGPSIVPTAEPEPIAAQNRGEWPVGWVTPSYQQRYLLNDGRLFFDSTDSLLPAASNAKQNVYEYESRGLGTCGSEADNGGCLSLVSTGTSASDSGFFDASAEGRDVFFTTAQRLVRIDSDNLIDLYDAREGGGIPSQNAPPPAQCQGDACQSPPSPPADQTPASAVFSGPGNPGGRELNPSPTPVVKSKPIKCKRGFVRKKVKKKETCVKKKSKKRAKKSSKSKRGGKS